MKKEKLLLSLDLDDTILNKNGKIPFLTLLGLKRILRKGNYIIINTARSLKSTIPYIKKLNLFHYFFICSNGSCIYQINYLSKVTKEINFFMDDNLLHSLFSDIKDFVEYASFTSEAEQYIYNKNKAEPFIYAGINEKKLKIINYTDISKLSKIEISSFGIKPSAKTKFEKIIKKSKYKNGLFTSWGEKNNILHYDLQKESMNKGVSLTKVMHLLKIKKENSIAFGDDLNDISMIKAAGKGYFLEKGKDIALKNNIEIIPGDASSNSVIKFLYKNHKELFY